jgi:hypothetical protein
VDKHPPVASSVRLGDIVAAAVLADLFAMVVIQPASKDRDQALNKGHLADLQYLESAHTWPRWMECMESLGGRTC